MRYSILHQRKAELCLVTSLILKFLSPCRAFSVSSLSKNTIQLPMKRESTNLKAGRERRSSTSRTNEGRDVSSKSSNVIYLQQRQKEKSLEQNLLAKEEVARQKRIGQAKHRLEKDARREDRISILEMKMKMINGNSSEISDADGCGLSTAERAELNGLLKVRDNFEEQYDPFSFTKEHVAFKALHNDAFIALSRYCERQRICSQDDSGDEAKDAKTVPEPINVFFLDGPDAGTTSALIDRGNFNANQCFVANRHKSTCDALRISGGGKLPDKNVVHVTASEALTVKISTSNTTTEKEKNDNGNNNNVLMIHEGGHFSEIDFGAYYFDGCGGFVPHVINMLSAALLNVGMNYSSVDTHPIAIGYSLLGSYKDIVEKELAVSRALTVIARRRGMRLTHVLDDPERFEISPSIKKTDGSAGGGTFTTWLLMESDN